MTDFAGPAAAAAIRSALERCDAAAAFGLPGGPNQVLFNAFRNARTRLIVPTHELAAAFMAGTYGRVDGRPGILLTIPGPGFAYALAGLAEAWQDSAPLVHIVRAPPEGRHPRHRHQALDQAAIVRPMVKAVFGVSELAQLGETVCTAFETARGGEPGPVVVQLGGPADSPGSVSDAAPADEAAARAIWKRIHQARKPVLLLGQGCSQSAAVIRAYVERTATPAFTTASGRGVIPEHSPWCLGYDSLRGSTEQLNAFLRETDLVIAIGARLAFNGTAGFGVTLPRERLVHIDASAANLNAIYPASNVVAMSVAAFFLLAESTASPRTAWTLDSLTPWRLRIRTAQAVGPEPTIAGHTPQQFFSLLRAALPDDALVVTDSGLHQVMARRYFEVREVHGLLLPTDLQSMGFALPSAIAAKLAAPSRPVVALVGDGGALMSGLELAVAVRERLPLTVIVFNDGYLNQIRMQQLLDSGRGHGVALPVLDFEGLADATGVDYVAGNSAIDESIGRAARGTGVTLIDVPVRDGVSVLAAAAQHRAKAVVRSALGTRWHTLRRWLRR
jgi:acetolactate synthase I/II/III large subunit